MTYFAAAVGALAAVGAAEGSSLPDFVIDARAEIIQPRITVETFGEDHCSDCIGPGTHKLLRYGTSFGNIGAPISFGSAPDEPGLRNHTVEGGFVYDWHECHNHYHNGVDFVVVDLLDSDGAMVVETKKIGFCYMDYFSLPESQYDLSSLPPSEFSCEEQGVTTGWADYYHGSLDCQWFQIDGLPAGNYTMRFSINENRNLEESNYDNNVQEFSIVITDDATPPAEAPANDLCANAAVLTVDGDGVYGTNEGSSHLSVGEPLLSWKDQWGDERNTTGATMSVWYRFMGTGTNMTVSTCHHGKSLYDTCINIYRGCPDADSAPVAINDDLEGCGILSEVTFLSSKGVDYSVMVAGWEEPDSEWGQLFITATSEQAVEDASTSNKAPDGPSTSEESPNESGTQTQEPNDSGSNVVTSSCSVPAPLLLVLLLSAAAVALS